MTNTVKVTSSLLAFWRHEFFAGLNIIQGYANLILDEIGDLEKDQKRNCAVSTLFLIQKNSKEIHADICRTLDSQITETKTCKQDIFDLRDKLVVETAPKIEQISSLVENLKHTEIIEFDSDLSKILAGTEILRNLLDERMSWLEEFIATDSSEKDGSDETIPLELSVNNASTLGDIEKSLSYIKKKQICLNSNHQNFRILIVDNNKDNQDILYRQLEKEHYLVDAVASGKKALNLLSERAYDLILLDIVMPGLNGYQVLQTLKSSSQLKAIPVIMISSLNEIDSISKCIELGAEDYLPKPFNFTLLQARVNACLEKKRFKDQERQYIEQLTEANLQISELNEKLKIENIRLSAELEITRQLQQLILPRESELEQIADIEIAGFMEPAEEVGGDYYDVHQHNGSVNISIGDITGHGLESGLLMIMVQTAVRTLIENHETNPKKLLNTLNRIIIDNTKRIESERSLTLSLLSYVKGTLNISGQHEDIIVVRAEGMVERIDTIDLGFPIGVEENIEGFINQTQLSLKSGDVVVLHTDGVSEAEDENGNQYGLERFCQVVSQNRLNTANEIKQAVVNDLKKHIGKGKILDDYTLLIIKKK